MVQEKIQKSNRQFMILSAIGIFFVVDAHAWSPISILGNLMPYNSYLMPMFVFISGYFLKMENVEHIAAFMMKKIKTLLFPFFVWNILYGILINLLKAAGIIYYGEVLSFQSIFIQPFLGCGQFDINTPAWFVTALFMVIVTYVCVRRVFNGIWNEYLAAVCFAVISVSCVMLARKGYSADLRILPAMKTGFLLFFYELGVLFRRKLEIYYRKVPRAVLLVVPLLVNAWMIRFTWDFNFTGIATMSGFTTDHYWIPIATSITGILFWLTVADILVPALGESRLVNCISNHTFTIMMHHIFFFNVYNAILAVLTRYSILHIPFDLDAFRSTAWYRYEPVRACTVWHVFWGMAGPLLGIWLAQKLKAYISRSTS